MDWICIRLVIIMAINLEKLFKEVYIVQNFHELQWLVDKVEKLNPTTILEVGVEQGGTMKVWEEILKENGRGKENKLIGIDLSPNLCWNINNSDIDVHMIKGNSHDIETLEKVKAILGREGNGEGGREGENTGRKLDFVYIDGEHNSLAAKNDFDFFGKMVRKGGAIGFHDVNDVMGFLNTLDKDKLEIFYGMPPYKVDKLTGKEIGMQQTIGTGIYYV